MNVYILHSIPKEFLIFFFRLLIKKPKVSLLYFGGPTRGAPPRQGHALPATLLLTQHSPTSKSQIRLHAYK